MVSKTIGCLCEINILAYGLGKLYIFAIFNSKRQNRPNLIFKYFFYFIKGYRKHLIRGEVHDPTAYSFSGVAGHAGFFSIAENL